MYSKIYTQYTMYFVQKDLYTSFIEIKVNGKIKILYNVYLLVLFLNRKLVSIIEIITMNGKVK